MIRKSHINFHQQMKSHIPSMCKHVTLELSSSKKKNTKLLLKLTTIVFLRGL